MQFKEVSHIKKYIKASELNSGELAIVAGKYLGPVASKFGGDNFEFEELETGEVKSLNGTKQLAYLMNEKAQVGDICRITYMGMEKLAKGPFAGKETHRFKLEIAVKEGEKTLSKTETDPDEFSLNDLK
jgi:putative methionine-R-sulfoxide reductase with GAF domain